MKEFKGNKIQRIVIALMVIEVLAILLLGVLMFTPKKTYTIFPEDGTNIILPYGHYYISCNYEIQKDINTVNYLHIQNLDGTKNGIAQTDNYLNEEHNSYTSEFWIKTLKKEINLSVREIGKTIESPSVLINSYEIKCTSYSFFIAILFVTLLLLFTIIAYFILIEKIKLNTEKIRNIIVMLVTIIISCLPLLGDSLLKCDDTLVHLIRLEGMKDAYLAGQFPVRVEPTFNGGYGYAFATYYGSLFYNIPAFLRLMGFSIQNAYKAYVVFVNIATTCLSYYSFKIIFKDSKYAVIGCILYSLSIYRLYDLYQRGAVGEYTAMIFLPLIAAGLWKIYTTPVDSKNYSRLWIMPVIGYSGVIESHVLSTELYGAFTIILCLIMAKKTFRKKTFIVLLKIVTISIVLNAGYLLPFIESYLCEDVIINSDLLIETKLSQGLSILDVFKFFTGGNDQSIWWREYIIGSLGPTVTIVILLLIYTIIKGISKDNKMQLIVTGSITLLSVILSLNVFPWNKLLTTLYYGPTNNIILNAVLQKISLLFINVQFRVRFLIVGIITYTLFTCIILYKRDNYKVIKIGKVLILLITTVQFIWAAIFIMIKSERITFNAICPEDVEVTCNIGNYEYMPLKDDGGMPYTIMFREPLNCLTTNAKVSEYKKQYTNIYIHVKTDDNVGIVELPLLYYRGYKAVDTDTGKNIVTFKSASNARLGIVVENGYEGNIKVYYAGKITWHIAEIVSSITFIIIIMCVYFKRKEEYEKKYT